MLLLLFFFFFSLRFEFLLSRVYITATPRNRYPYGLMVWAWNNILNDNEAKRMALLLPRFGGCGYKRKYGPRLWVAIS